jgi:hypothetical protein
VKEKKYMKKFLIEVPHAPDKTSCDHAIQVFMESGSHFLTHAEWGCTDGEHKAWIIIEVESKEEARLVVPPFFRPDAKITKLVTFTSSDLKETGKFHSA